MTPQPTTSAVALATGRADRLLDLHRRDEPLPVLERTPLSHSSAPPWPSVLDTLSQTERETLRRLAQRYRFRGNGTVRPAADVAYDLRSRHHLDVTTQDVHALLAEEAAAS